VAVLPAPAEPVTNPAAAPSGRLRTAWLAGAGVALLFVFVPPVWTFSHRYEYVETIQFVLAAFAVPALVVLGWPFRWLGGRSRGQRLVGALERLASSRRRHPWAIRSLTFAALEVGVVIAWRTPALMNALERHSWLLVVEVGSLVVAGVLLWTELVRCPPLLPRLPSPWRAVIGAGTMWGVWVMAYLVGFSHVSWYVAFHHAAGGLRATTDQELSTAVLWFAAACSFVPLVFQDLLAWLKNGEDPDAELRAIVRRERRLGGGPE